MRSLLFSLFSSMCLVSMVHGDYVAKSYDSLLGNLPGIDDQVLKMHFKLYQGYVANTNKLLSSLKDMEKDGKLQTPEYAGLKRIFGWEWDGMRLHEFYFDSLGNAKKLDPDSNLAKAIARDFNSYEAWEKDFKATGLIRGIGWAILYLDNQTGRLVNTWINEHNLGHLAGGTVILPMDVFEHAYITQYGLDRGKYVDAFLANINWEVVQKRFAPSKNP